MILAGDVGGTKTLVALFERDGDVLRSVREQSFPSADHASLEEVIERFLAAGPSVAVEALCFGVAGAVVDGRAKVTNLPWVIDEAVLARVSGARIATLLNDLQATAYGMLFLPAERLACLNAGARVGRRGPAAVLAAGTGLGEATLFWDGLRHHPAASEGGHADLAVRNDLEIDLFRFLRAELGGGHVSYERVLSGPGLTALYRFLRARGTEPEPDWLARELATTDDPNVPITLHGLSGAAPLCAATLALFAELYGAEAGNHALRTMATGGVFLGGGIAPRILPVLAGGAFLRGFLDKGRFAPLLETFPVWVSLEPRTGLVGAAYYAAR